VYPFWWCVTINIATAEGNKKRPPPNRLAPHMGFGVVKAAVNLITTRKADTMRYSLPDWLSQFGGQPPYKVFVAL